MANMLDKLRRPKSVSTDPSTLPLSSPWSTAELRRLVWEDVFGTPFPANSRSAAMGLSPVSRSRNLLVGTISRFPLRARAGVDPLETSAPAIANQPSWMYRTNTAQSPQHRIAWTVDDLIFSGASCWWADRGADGFPLSMHRLNQDEWEITEDNRVLVNGIPASDEQVVVITGLHEGILTYAKDDLARYARLMDIVTDRLENPTPAIDLHQTEGADLTSTERDELLAVWRQARRAKGGSAVGYTNKAIEAKVLGDGLGEQLLIEARNAGALELARHVGVAGGRIDATAPKASLNYETTTGRNHEFVDFDLALYMTPITARLSLDDCVPAGVHTVLDMGDFTGPVPSPTGPNLQD